MEIKDLKTELERKLYVEIIGERDGLQSYFDSAKDNNYYDEVDTFEREKIRLELLIELSKIIEDEK
tara:strand:- start:3121 stop:3318 length:198 start_codon:yes stop_codon:yes gene_type:complete